MTDSSWVKTSSMYKAIIAGKNINNGMLNVIVDFNAETDSVREVFQTNQEQTESWLNEQIQSKLAHLNSLPALHDSIKIGPAEEVEGDDADDEARAQYIADYATFTQMVNALCQGIITSDNPDFLALKAKLAANFKVEYLDIF